MKVRVSEIPEEGLEIDERVSLALDGSEVPSHLKLRIEKQGEEVLVKGEVEAQLVLTCGRCLKEFTKEASVPVDLVYRPLEELRDEVHELEPDEMDTGFYKGDELDIDTIAAEQVLLSMPMRPLCSEACRGMCPNCGADLNLETCGCAVKTDKDKAGLKKLFEGKE
jgi:uncharacterized protein